MNTSGLFREMYRNLRGSCWVLLTAILLLSSCYYDVEEEIYPDVGCDIEQITYTDDVLPIIQSNCYRCHDQANNFGGVTLEGYDNLKRFVDNDRLLGAIRHEPGFSPMPQDRAQLPECTIQKIETWVADGAPDN